MNPEQVIARQAVQIEELRVAVQEAREMALLLAGHYVKRSQVTIESREAANLSLRGEKMEGNRVRFYVERGVPDGDSQDS